MQAPDHDRCSIRDRERLDFRLSIEIGKQRRTRRHDDGQQNAHRNAEPEKIAHNLLRYLVSLYRRLVQTEFLDHGREGDGGRNHGNETEVSRQQQARQDDTLNKPQHNSKALSDAGDRSSTRKARRSRIDIVEVVILGRRVVLGHVLEWRLSLARSQYCCRLLQCEILAG